MVSLIVVLLTTFIFPCRTLFYEKKRCLVIAVHHYGLSNRLRTIADWYVIAVATSRQLIVSWKPNAECNITLQELIKSGPSDMKVLPFYIASNETEGALFIQDICNRNNATFSFINSDSTGFILSPDIVASSEIDIVLTYYDGVLTLKDTPCEKYLTHRSEFLSKLVPVDDITNIVKQVKDTHFKDQRVVGVHIRMHDTQFDWSVVPPPPMWNLQTALKFGEGATIDDFKMLSTLIQSHFNSSNLNNSSLNIRNLKFFITSNSDEVKQIFTNHFPESLSIRGDTSRDTTNGMKLAFIEWLLLSETSLIINTYGSSYAVEAASRKMVPIIGIWGGLYIFHSNVKLPYCGHFQYMKSYSEQGYDLNFTEGTKDNREIKGRVIPLQPCNDFEQLWGIPIVYCSSTDEEAKHLT